MAIKHFQGLLKYKHFFSYYMYWYLIHYVIFLNIYQHFTRMKRGEGDAAHKKKNFVLNM